MTPEEQAPLIDASVEKLDIIIGQHMAEKMKLEEQLKTILTQIDWQTRRIRELSQQRSITLNFNLPGIEP